MTWVIVLIKELSSRNPSSGGASLVFSELIALLMTHIPSLLLAYEPT